jgi:hypothetical protein
METGFTLKSDIHVGTAWSELPPWEMGTAGCGRSVIRPFDY